MGRQPAPCPPLRRVPIRGLLGSADPAGGPGDHAHGSRTAPDVADQARPRDDRRLLGPLGPPQLLNYVGTMEPRPERVIVNHGEEFKCSDLASGLYKKFGLETRAPMNLETIRLK